MDSRGHPAANRATKPATAEAQPARKTKSGTYEESLTEHEGTHAACQMVSEN